MSDALIGAMWAFAFYGVVRFAIDFASVVRWAATLGRRADAPAEPAEPYGDIPFVSNERRQ